MRYDKENEKLIISFREFVSIARRKVSKNLPQDINEPEHSEPSRRLLNNIIGECKTEKLMLETEISSYAFQISGYADKVDKCNLWLAFDVEIDPARPTKEYSAQLRGEGYLAAYAYAIEKGLTRVELNLIFINSKTGAHTEMRECVKLEKLKSFFDKCAIAVSVFAKPEIERVTERVPSMKSAKFPYKSREGQGEFVKRAYKTISRGGTLFATAPTGTGKTVAALYPAIRAMGDERCDKTFYLTPKETTALAALETLSLLSENGVSLRAIKLTAKEKTCKNGLLCRNSKSSCENARINNVSDAALALYHLNKTIVTNDDVHEIARKFKVCPYELELTYSELCDVIVCDVNYLFDPVVYIHRFFTEGGRYAFLIDEAHNLPDRAREMYSAEISADAILAPATTEVLGEFSPLRKISNDAYLKFHDILFEYVKEDIRTDEKGEAYAATHTKEPPVELYEIFDTLVAEVEKEIQRSYSSKTEDASEITHFLRSYFYTVKKFRDTLMRFDGGYEMFIFFKSGEISAKLFCIDTGNAISQRLAKGHAAVFFSATLTPLYYYKSLLGGDGSSDMLELPSPFDREQIAVRIMDKISTRYSEREDTLSAVCRAIAATVSARRGKYMIFSPSFAYSEALSKAFSAKYPKIKVLTQKRDMTQKEKELFLGEFSSQNNSYVIGFCVMGGVFSEGINLVGESLIGAVIVGIGMPALSFEREAISSYYDEKYEEGRQFAYIYPGMNKVMQAAGRVIRQESDRGVVVLIDDRFDDPIYKKIIPSFWRGLKFIPDAKVLREELDKFWLSVDEESSTS